MREPWRLACPGGKTPAKPHTPLRPCAHSAQSGIKGHCPLREPRGLLPSGGNSAANPLSLTCPAPYGRGVRVKGHCP